MSRKPRLVLCPNCGAKLDPSGEGPTLHCGFCGAVVEKDAPREVERHAAPAKGEKGEKEEKREKKKGKGDIPFFLYVGGVVLCLVGGFGWEYFVPRRHVTGKPLVVDADGDGVEDLLVQYDEDYRGSQTARLALVDGKKHSIVWTFAFPKKKYANALPYAVGSGYVLVGDPKPVANILDLRTGAVRATMDLPDTASRVYASGTIGWIDTDRKSLRVDATTGKATRVGDPPLSPDRPPWAPHDAFQTCPQATCRSGSTVSVADMNVSNVYVDGTSDDAVAVGQKENGTHLPMLAGVSLSTKATRWTRILQAADAATPQYPVIANGRVVFEYTDGKVRKLACASVATGEIVWEVPSKEKASRTSGIVVGQNVYVQRSGVLEIDDAKTGKLVGTFP
jgi:outer membrane protein assembly factor BamB